MQPTQALLVTTGTASDEVRQFFEGLTSVEMRIAATVALVAVTVVVGVLVAPRLVRYVSGTVTSRLGSGRWAGVAEALADYVPTTFGGVLLRAVQLTLLLATVVTLLLVWGLVDTATDVLFLMGLSAPFLLDLAGTVLLVVGAYVVAELLEDTVRQFSEGADRITDHQEEVMIRIGHIGILALVVPAALTLWSIDLSGLIVGAGFLGIVVGLAARQTLGSMIAGFVLMFSRPFTIGDWAEIGDHEGIVTDITIFNTRLETFDGEFIVIPNDIVGNQPITNRSQKGHLRIRQDVGIDYDVDPDHAVEVAIDAMEGLDAIEGTPPPQVIPKSFGDSAVVLELRFWIDRPTPPRKWQAKSAVTRAVKAAFDEADVTIPFPQRSLSARAEAGGFPVEGQAAVDASDRTAATDAARYEPVAADDHGARNDGEPADDDAPDDGDEDGDADDASADDQPQDGDA